MNKIMDKYCIDCADAEWCVLAGSYYCSLYDKYTDGICIDQDDYYRGDEDDCDEWLERL